MLPDEIVIFLESIFSDIFKNVNDSSSLIKNIILTVIVLFSWRWLFRKSKKLIYSWVQNIKTYTISVKIVQNVLMVISILLLLGIWAHMKNTILLVLTIFAILMGLSLKNLFANIVGWFMLLRKKYFKLYDRIEIMDIKGDVIKITPIYFKVIERGNELSSSTATGRIINIPNHFLLNNSLLNYNSFMRLNFSEVKYYLTVDSDWQSALNVMEKELALYLTSFLKDYTEEELKRMNSQLQLMEEELKIKTYLKVEEDYLLLIGQYPILFSNGTSTESMLNQKILPQLNVLPNVELNNKTTHIDVEKFPNH